jgi:hypothetical protein
VNFQTLPELGGTNLTVILKTVLRFIVAKNSINCCSYIEYIYNDAGVTRHQSDCEER